MQVSNADKRAVDTPALFVDLDVLEAEHRAHRRCLPRNGINWRPHTKGIKVPQIAHMQIDGGRIGDHLRQARRSRGDGGARIRDILIANQIVGPQKIARLVALRPHLRRHRGGRQPRECRRRSPRPRAARASPSASSSRWTWG